MDLDAIEQRYNAATEGPWGLERVGDFHDPGWMIADIIRDPKGDNALDFGTDKALGTFVAASRTDVPDMVARVRELEGELDDTAEVKNAQLAEVNRQRNALMTRARGLEAELGAAVGTAEALRVRVLELRTREEARDERIKELEDENILLRRQLNTALGKRPGTWDTWDEHVARKEATPTEPRPKPHLTLEQARRQAAAEIARVRDIAKEEL